MGAICLDTRNPAHSQEGGSRSSCVQSCVRTTPEGCSPPGRFPYFGAGWSGTTSPGPNIILRRRTCSTHGTAG